MQELLSFLKPESNWRPPALSSLPSWAGAKRVGIDCETKDPYLKQLGPGARREDSYIVGVSFAIEDGPKFYLPFRHQGGDNLEEAGVFAYLHEQSLKFSGILVGANMSYDLDFLAKEKINFPFVQYCRDVQIADPLIYELYERYSLAAISQRWGLPPKEETLLKEAAAAYNVDPKAGLWKLPARYVGPYAEQDAELPLKILRKQELEIEKRELWDIFNLESKVLPVLLRMRQRGVRIDLDKLGEIEKWTLEQEALCLEEVKHHTGVSIAVGEVWKGAALVPALEALGIKLSITEKSKKKQVDKDLFASYDHPVTRALARARKVNKLRTTFAESIRTHMIGERIHCTFNQLAMADISNEEDVKGARFGRLSAEHPNMQQQPSKDEFAAMWRSIYIPEEGKMWCSGDYSQQEPRMTVHFAELMGYEKAKEAGQRYRDDPATDNHQMMADMIKGAPASAQERKYAKEIFLGLCYGMGGGKLSRKLGLPTQTVKNTQGRVYEAAGPEGQALLDKFNQEVPFVKKLARKLEEVAKDRGYIKTILGRHLHFPVDAVGNYDWTHKALNRLIQGSSADQTKKAMVDLDAAGFFIQLQVHDEITASIEYKEDGDDMAALMCAGVPLKVPSKVDIEIGPSWGEAK